METTAPDIEAITQTPLSAKIYRASRRLSRQAQWQLFTLGLITCDLITVGLAFVAAFWARFLLPISWWYPYDAPPLDEYRLLVLFLLPLWLALIAISGLYNRQNLLGGTQEYSRTFRATSIALLIVIVAGFLEPDLIIARGWLLLAWVFTFLFLAVGRFILRRVVYQLRRYGYFLTPAVIVGANQEGRWLAEQFVNWKTSGLHVVGFVDDVIPTGTLLFHNLYALGPVDQIEDIIAKFDVGELILATSAMSSRNKIVEIFKKYGVSDKVNLRMSSGLYEIITTGLTVSEFAYVPLVRVNKARLAGLDEALKFILDYSLTIFGLLMGWPLLAALAIAVKLDSPGPVIHRRWVMGMNGRRFPAYKFRTMYIDGDKILAAHPDLQAELARNHKLKDDPRITRIGRILRKLSLDELPQLFNVLKREMSLVGPRMITAEEMSKYDQWDMNLLTVRPGITGLWQVSGRSDVSYEERVQMDMFYVRNWSIWLDLQLIFQTIPAVLKSRGAY